ncbi:MAG: HIT family protein [Crocinitomicaceae bacterium]|jgi:histidine triad (HIT) family protein|nr:HIT family protein [Crocinitomicaceae bacterium]
MASLFTKIIQREIPAHIIAEDDQFLAFLDVFPLRKGHTLVIPKKEVDNYFDLTDEDLSDLMVFAKKVSKKIAANFPCKKVGVAVVGLEVPHAHVHLIAINSVSDMDFKQEKLQLSSEELAEIARILRD